jgi:hypothetical protein
MTAVVALVLFAGLFLWLIRTTARDLDDTASILGLQKATARVQARGTSAEGFAYHETRMLEGTFDGVRAELAVRTVKRRQNPYRRRGSQFTVLTLHHGRADAPRLRLQPAGMMEALETLQKGERTDVVATGDAAFDAAYRLYAADPAAALAVLTPVMRRDLLAFRSTVAGLLPDAVTGGMAAALLLGTFEVEPGLSRYTLFGSPTKTLAEHLRQAVPFMMRLTGAR